MLTVDSVLRWVPQDVIVVQEKCISDLLKAVKEQHEQLSQQKIKIKIMEEKVPHDQCTSSLWQSTDTDHYTEEP